MLKELLKTMPWMSGDSYVAEALLLHGVYSIHSDAIVADPSFLKYLPKDWIPTGARYEKYKASVHSAIELDGIIQCFYFLKTDKEQDAEIALIVGHSSKQGVGIKTKIDTINRIFFCSTSEEVVTEFEELLKKHEAPRKKEKDGSVYLFGMTHGEVRLNIAPSPIKSKIVPQNYSKEVFEKHQFVCANIAAKNTEQGKIAIYQGPPGTGKTYAIRNLISGLNDCFVVLIAPGMLKELAAPSFVPLLIMMNSQNKPIIFILEDADEILGKRTKENIDSLSNLLNFGDGILGSILDVRIVASTNAKIKEFDEAIMRPGRLLSFVEFDKLSVPECAACIKNITPEIEESKLPIVPRSLAECYVIARDGKKKEGKKNGNTRNQKKNQAPKKLYH